MWTIKEGHLVKIFVNQKEGKTKIYDKNGNLL